MLVVPTNLPLASLDQPAHRGAAFRAVEAVKTVKPVASAAIVKIVPNVVAVPVEAFATGEGRPVQLLPSASEQQLRDGALTVVDVEVVHAPKCVPLGRHRKHHARTVAPPALVTPYR